MEWIFRKIKEKPVFYITKFARKDLYNEDGDLTIKWENEKSGVTESNVVLTLINGEIEEYYFEDGVINNVIFSKREDIASVELKSGIKKISYDAFWGCKNLLSINIPDTVETIGSRAFSGCISLTGISFADNCILKEIGPNAFNGCYSLTEINIPSSVVTIRYGAFENCTNLNTVVFGENPTIEAIGGTSFKNCTSLEEFIIPNSVKYIEYSVFKGCVNLKEIFIPNSVLEIRNDVFMDCTSLKTATFEDNSPITTIYMNLFRGCTSLEEITLPNKLEKIASYAFENCAIKSIELPETLRMISSYAFRNCSELTEIKSNAEICPKISNTTFIDVASEGTLTPPSEESDYSTWLYEASYFLGYYGWTNSKAKKNYNVILTLVDGTKEQYVYDGPIENNKFARRTNIYSVEINSGVTGIGESAFIRCNNLVSVTINGDVKTIGNSAFSTCTSLSSITLNSGITTIGDSAFYNCMGIVGVSLPNSITSIGEEAFHNCRKLSGVTLSVGLNNISKQAFMGCVELNSVIIPARVVTLNESAFEGCFKLSKVTFLGNIKTIGDRAFRNCNSLETVSGLTGGDITIGNSAFLSCNLLSKINFTKMTKIGESAFRLCKNITGALSLSSVSDIGINAFMNCYSITSLNIGNNLTDISSGAFKNCTSLERVTNGTAIRTIGSEAFFGCNNLKNISFFNKENSYVEKIGSRAFYNCSELSTIEFGNNVSEIGVSAFSNCTKLEKIKTNGKAPIIFSNTFLNVKEYGTLEYADAYEDEYISKWLKTDQYYLGYYKWNYKYTLTITIDGVFYTAITQDVGTTIPPIPTPTREGYRFSWDEPIPTVMPNYDLTINGSFTVSQYILKFIVDGVLVSSGRVDYNSVITYPSHTEREGYSFSWDSSITNMPARNVTINGVYTVNQYTLTLTVEGEPYTSITQDYGSVISVTDPTKEGYGFSWDTPIPTTMPAENITINGTFTLYNVILILSNGNKEGIILTGDTISGTDGISGRTDVVSVEIIKQITDISENAFNGCSQLTGITMPDTVETIKNSAFKGCNLSEFILPESLNKIGGYAFQNNHSLSIIVCNENAVSACTTSFKNVSENGTLVYSSKMAEHYNDNWLDDNKCLNGWFGIDSEYNIVMENTETDDEGVTLSGYRITTANDAETYSGRNPITWSLYGSNTYSEEPPSTGVSNWTLLDEHEDDYTLGPENYKNYYFEIPEGNRSKYQYYLLEFDAVQSGTVIQLGEFRLFDESGKLVTKVNCYHCSSGQYYGNNDIPDLFDNDNSTKYCADINEPLYIYIEAEKTESYKLYYLDESGDKLSGYTEIDTITN